MKAEAWCSAFRIAARDLHEPEIIESIYRSMTEDAERSGRVPHHRNEETFLFPDGSALVYDHDEARARVTFEKV